MSELFAAIAASDEWQTMLDILPDLPFATWESFYATVLTTVLALVIGLPLGVLLVVGDSGGAISTSVQSLYRAELAGYNLFTGLAAPDGSSLGNDVRLTIDSRLQAAAYQALGGKNLDGVVVAVSENLEAGIMATMLCKEMGIPLVVAKAKNKLHGAILQRVGADRIVYPEIEMGSRVAKSLVSREFMDWI